MTTIASGLKNTPHRFCANHFLRDLAKLILEKDSHAKVQMRRKVRGLRTIEKETLAELDTAPKKDDGLEQSEREY